MCSQFFSSDATEMKARPSSSEYRDVFSFHDDTDNVAAF